MKKRIILMVMLSMIVFVLAACAGNKNDSDDYEPEPEEKREVLSQFAEDDGSIWQESWMEETASGDSIKVDINAEVKVPRISRMSAVEVRKYEFSNENKKRIAETVFDDDIYYGDTEKLPRSELEVMLEQKRENLQSRIEEWQGIGSEDNYELYKDDYDIYKSDLEKDIEQEKKQLEKFEEVVRNASDDYTKVQGDDYQGEIYFGKRDGIQYSLDFTGQSIWISPVEQEDIFPDKAKGTDGYVSYFPKKQEEVENECELKRKEAEKLARDFTQKIGFSGLVLKETKDLLWHLAPNGRPGEGEYFADGWAFSFSAGVDDVAFDSFGVEGDDIYRVGKEEYPARKNYPLYCSMEIYVTERGVIEVSCHTPIEIQSVTPGVKLLPLKEIKGIVKDGMKEYAEFYIDKGKGLVGAINFTYMELVYYRMDDPDDEDCFTYIPAWRLRKSGNQQLYYIINAIDGSLIRDWESTWHLSEDWVV